MSEITEVQQVYKSENPTFAFVTAFVDELQRSGVRHAIICPGSRSTPLAMILAACSAIRTWVHVDERSAAFFALGLSKCLQQPVLLLCTSGTATANFLPAIIEARLTHIPLLVVTADRPPELRDCGAPQAIDQNRLYGTHVKWFVDVALPEATNEVLRYIRTIACRAVSLAQAVPAGPVHLNMPFREPLVPVSGSLLALELRDASAWSGRADNKPYVQVQDVELGSLDEFQLERLATLLAKYPHGVLFVGPQVHMRFVEPILQLAQALGYPVFADPLSQVRGHDPQDKHIIASYDAFLRLEGLVEQLEPQLIIRFGAMPTSKPLLLYIKRYAYCHQIVIDEHGTWDEPTQLVSELLHVSAEHFCRSLLPQLVLSSSTMATRGLWLQRWQDIEHRTRQVLLDTMEQMPPFFEGALFPELAALLPEGSVLYVGNSMPVRDMDTFFWKSSCPIRVLGNRGANGIDGIISSALGASAGNVLGHTVLVIGDLSFFHDLNSLLLARLYQLSLIVILVNNDGGGIFSFLPQSAYPEHFEQLFGTPLGIDFCLGVEMYGGVFRRVAGWEAFRSAVQDGLMEGGLHVIEVPSERELNVKLHRRLWSAVQQAIG